jgi:hypothetical protein
VWDGNREYPTITPAFDHVVAGQIHWNGFVQRGEWIGVIFVDEERDWIQSPTK